MSKDIWLPVLGFEKVYEVSNMGEVRSVARSITRIDGVIRRYKSRPLKPSKSRGRYFFYLQDMGVKRYVAVHQVVWEAFNGVIKSTKYIRHIDRDNANNALENLEVRTVRSMMVDRHKNKEGIKRPFTGVVPVCNRFSARIRVNGKDVYLGSYRTAYEAHVAYRNKAERLDNE